MNLLLARIRRVLRTNPRAPAAAVLPDLKILIDRYNRALRAVHADSDVLKAQIGGAEKLFDSIDFLL